MPTCPIIHNIERPWSVRVWWLLSIVLYWNWNVFENMLFMVSRINKIVVNCTNFETSVWNLWCLDLLRQALITYWCPGGEICFYQQTQGAAMGSLVSDIVALEPIYGAFRRNLSITPTTASMWLRYVDDTLWTHYLIILTTLILTSYSLSNLKSTVTSHTDPGGEMAQTSVKRSCRRWVVAGSSGPCL